MSHEIRTPINAVLGMDEMILRETEESSIKAYAMDIYTAGQTLLSLINDILDISKIESGKMEIVPVRYDLSSLIHDLMTMTDLRASAKGLEIKLEVDETLPSWLYGDDVRIRQVLTNILTNAVKYTKEGSVTFRVGGKKDGENLLLHFEVEDTGIGIKEEDIPKLFEAFERIEESRNRNIEGTGLGMNITIQILALMDSKLEVESEYGKGSRFFFTLRQKIEDETPIGDLEKRIKETAESYSYKEELYAPGAKILVVDDNDMNRRVFVGLLKPTGIKVYEASGGAECLEKVKQEHFDMIFLDHMMPEMDGVETFERMKELKEAGDYSNAGTPVIALTANAVAGAKEFYLNTGFDAFLSKPIVSSALEALLKEKLPEELKEERPAEEASGDETPAAKAAQRLPASADIQEKLPAVDGLDWNYAFLHLGDEKLVYEAVRDFYDLIPGQAKVLSDCYAHLPDREKMNAYRIQVHAMKSSAGTIGIIPLAGMANVLEYAARDDDLNTVMAIHKIFLDFWNSYRERLKAVFEQDEEKTEKKESADREVILALFSMLENAMENFDIDGADKAVEQLSGFDWAESEASFEELKTAVKALDDDEVKNLIERLKKGLK